MRPKDEQPQSPLRDRVARSLALGAFLLSACALSAVLFSLQRKTDNLPTDSQKGSTTNLLPASPEVPTSKYAQVPVTQEPKESTGEALPHRIQTLEQEFEILRKTVTNTEKIFEVTVDPNAPDMTEDVIDEETGRTTTVNYASIPLAELSPSLHEVVEVNHRHGNTWYIFEESRWEVRGRILLLRLGRTPAFADDGVADDPYRFRIFGR